MKCTVIWGPTDFMFLQVTVSSVFALLVFLDVVVKLTLMNVHLSLVTMVQVVWTYPRDIVASVPLVSYTKVIILNPRYYIKHPYFLVVSYLKALQGVGGINNSARMVIMFESYVKLKIHSHVKCCSQ
jgi:hypothetical protein